MTDIAETEVVTSQPANPRAGYWKFWGTTLWSIAIFAAWFVFGVLALFVVLLRLKLPENLTDQELRALVLSSTTVLCAGLGAATVGAFAVLALAVRLSRLPLRDYLGFTVPRWRDLVVGWAGLALLYASTVLASRFFGPLPSKVFVVNLYHSALATDDLPLLAAALIVVAPLSEEILFRGFLLPGWAASKLRPAGAILLTAAIWSLVHDQYYSDFIGLAVVFALGLWLGWIRYRSGSTLTTIVLHATQNAAALGVVAIFNPPA